MYQGLSLSSGICKLFGSSAWERVRDMGILLPGGWAVGNVFGVEIGISMTLILSVGPWRPSLVSTV